MIQRGLIGMSSSMLYKFMTFHRLSWNNGNLDVHKDLQDWRGYTDPQKWRA